MSAALELLKNSLGTSLVSVENLRPQDGVSTGIKELDQFLLWNGLPKGDLSLFKGAVGSGSTSLWVQSVKQLHLAGKWAAWIGSSASLCPHHLSQRGVKLNQLLVVEPDSNPEAGFWMAQELITSSLFDSIAIQFHDSFPKNHQLQKLKSLARTHKVSVVLIAHEEKKKIRFNSELFPLVIDFNGHNLNVQRALHRPTPFLIQKKSLPALTLSLSLSLD